MRFSVPQFIDVEDKIIGPLTLKQGVYIIGGVGVAVVLFIQFGFLVAILFGGPIFFLSFLLAFVKIHGRPFIDILASAFFFATKNKLYLWKKTTKKGGVISNASASLRNSTSPQVNHPASVEMSQSRLKKLAWSLDTNNMFDSKKD